MERNINILESYKELLTRNSHQDAADLLVAYLDQLGVEYVFGIPGGAIEPLFNALARSERINGPKVVVARHETGAAFMADGYTRNSGKLGVCCATTGPGATNLITGVASAFENNVPMLVITAQTALKNFGRKAFQESSDTGINIVGMFQYCTAYNTMVTHPEQLERKLLSAIIIALNEKRPVHLSIPTDIFSSPATIDKLHNIEPRLKKASQEKDQKFNELYKLLRNAKKIVFVLGANSREGVGLIQKCAFTLNANIVTTPDGKGLISPYHPLFKGVIGFAGHRLAQDTLADENVDLVVAVGSPLSEWATNSWDAELIFNSRLIHIDDSPENLSRTPAAKLNVQGSVVEIFEGLLDLIGLDPVTPYTVEKISKSKLPAFIENVPELTNGWKKRRVLPQWLMHQLPGILPPFACFFADVGNSMAWAIHYLHPFERRLGERRDSVRKPDSGRRNHFAGFFQTTIEFAAMGWAIGASIGAALANKERPIVCITGDGSVLMNGQEITVAQELALPIIFIVLNDGALGMVKHGQRLTGAEPIGFSLPQVDFAMLARSMGIRSFNIRCPDDLLNLKIDSKCLAAGPILLDVWVDPEQVPPIISRTSAIQKDRVREISELP